MYDNKLRGSIWKNDKKQSDTHPDFTGSYEDENGVQFWVSAWKRKADASPNAPALSFSMKAKEEKPQQPAPSQDNPQPDFDESQDIPF